MREQLTIEVLEALVGFDTTSRNSNLALVEWVEVYLDRLGVAHERVPDKTQGGKKRINGPPPQPTLPAVRHAILELFARLPPQRCPHCRKWICNERRPE